MKDFADILAIELRRIGKSQAELARDTGLAPATVARMLAGERRIPRAKTLRQIAQFFSWSYDPVTNAVTLADGTQFSGNERSLSPLEETLEKARNTGAKDEEIITVINKAFNLKAVSTGKKRHTS